MANHMTGNSDIRRRRALYRAQHRGTKEMDLVLGGYAAARLENMGESELRQFERLLALPDPDIEASIYAREMRIETELTPLINSIRRFHGIESASN
jgi:antitoxin CptB